MDTELENLVSRLNEDQSLVRLADGYRMMASPQVVEEPIGISRRNRAQKGATPIEDPQESMLRTDRYDGAHACDVRATVESGSIDVLVAVKADLARLKDDPLADRAKVLSLKVEYLNPVVLGIRDVQVSANLADAKPIRALGRGDATVDFVSIPAPERRSSRELAGARSMFPESQ